MPTPAEVDVPIRLCGNHEQGVFPGAFVVFVTVVLPSFPVGGGLSGGPRTPTAFHGGPAAVVVRLRGWPRPPLHTSRRWQPSYACGLCVPCISLIA